MEITVVIFEYIGVASAAITGTMAGIEKRADAFGVLFLAMVTALGGGIMRDIFLGEFPPRMFTSFIYIGMVTFFSLVVFADACIRGASYRAHKERLDAINNIFDALGLASFTIVGMDITIGKYGLVNPVLIILMGMTTGVGGGMIRDMLTNAMPKVLYKRIYAIASVAGGLLYYGFLRLGLNKTVGALVAIGFIVTLRILATKYRWNLPHAEP